MIDYKDKFDKLVKKCHSKKLRVKTDWNNRKWRGMNSKAAKANGVKRFPKRTLALAKSENTFKKKYDTLDHEFKEFKGMRNNSLSEYNRVHKRISKHDIT